MDALKKKIFCFKSSILNRFSPRVKFLIKSSYSIIIYGVSLYHWRRLRTSGPIRLDLGAGPKRGQNGWTTVDLYGADISWNLAKKIPLPDSIVSEIYTSHMLEHLNDDQIRKMLQECHRLLEPKSGKIRIVVPDARKYVDAYINNQLFKPRENWYQKARIDTETPIDQLNYIAYMGGQHKYMFDNKNLYQIVQAAGFINIEESKFDPAIDEESRSYESLYLAASKRG